MDELKQALGILAAAEAELAGAAAKVRAAMERAASLAAALKLPPGKPFSADKGLNVFGVTSDGKLFRAPVEHV